MERIRVFGDRVIIYNWGAEGIGRISAEDILEIRCELFATKYWVI